jgi:hypothetical protein
LFQAREGQDLLDFNLPALPTARHIGKIAKKASEIEILNRLLYMKSPLAAASDREGA